ncbi:E3 ubiquitin- ligase DZIP3, partial [Paramuricea clavata]
MMDPVKAKANYSRVCQLLVDKGGEALRGALHAKHPPSTLAAVLNPNKTTLKKIRYSVIKPSQWDLLFPVSGTPDSNNFDITLLTILLRNICGLTSPAAGWSVMPVASDTSISADILRIKICRNEVYGHIPTAQYDDTTFETLWQKIAKPLIKLGIPQQDIDELKEAPLSPEEESYIEKLKEWKELEDDLLSKLKDLERGVLNVQNEVLELRTIVENVVPSQVDQLAKFDYTGKIDRLCKKFQNGTREWFFDKLSSWFDDEESRVMILTAGPGAAKSVLSAKSLASQMCDNVDGFRDKLTEVLRREHSRESLSDAFRVLLNNPLHALDRREPMMIVVDALDESKTDDKSEFLELISEEFIELQEWIKIFVTSRPELQLRKKLRHFNPVEILPDDRHRKLDLEHFIHHCLPNMNQGNVSSLISKCEGSFLYAYYLVTALKKMDLGIEPNLNDYLPKGISGFYEKQFERLKTGLQSSIPDTWSSVFKSFLNVVAASREPLPMKILVSCMGLGLSSEEYVMRETIIGIMSEILPLYNDCLTVYHKSLWDWLTLDGYEEHAFVGDVTDGTKRLWRACDDIYSDIDSLGAVTDFQISPEKKYALKNGGKYLLDVGVAEDFHWLVNVRLNFLKLKCFDSLNVSISGILKFYKIKDPDYHYWSNIHLLAFSEILSDHLLMEGQYYKRKFYIYLQSLANGYFDVVHKTIDCKTEARDILEETNEVWVEEIEREICSNFKIVSHAIVGNEVSSLAKIFRPRALSPDNKLLAYRGERTTEVFAFPGLTMVFDLEMSKLCPLQLSQFLIFSPDSAYLLCNSMRSCISIREQKEVPFIPHGPEDVDCCSFSSCGMKFVTSEKNLIKVWDVKKKNILVQVRTEVDIEYCMFSNCNSYILARPVMLDLKAFDFSDIALLESRTLERIDLDNISCANTCLTNEDSYQIISPSDRNIFNSC